MMFQFLIDEITSFNSVGFKLEIWSGPFIFWNCKMFSYLNPIATAAIGAINPGLWSEYPTVH